MHGLRARGRAGSQGTGSVGDPQGHRVDVDKGEPIEILLVGLMFMVLLGGLPVEPLDDENVLESVLGDHEEGVGEVEGTNSVPWSAGHNGHNGVVGNGILP